MKRKKKIPLATEIGGDGVASSIPTLQNGEFSLYFHVPFCTRKCDYCHFYVLRDNKKLTTLFLEALRQEWKLRAPLFASNKPVSIYFGGGTPSLLEPSVIGDILSWITPHSECEITLEANPENITLERVRAFKEMGINRLSIGVQSFDHAMLVRLGRTHDGEKAYRAVYETEQAGVSNISIDVMFDLPHQTLDLWKRTLERAASLPITHLSLYNMTLEPPSLFYKKRESIGPQMPDEATSLQMLQLAIAAIQQYGLQRYEISAFAKPGFKSCHNLGYWTGRPFIGFGPSAFSYWNGVRFQNHCNLQSYATDLKQGAEPIAFSEKLISETAAKERLAIGLRVLNGVHLWPDALKRECDLLIEHDLLRQDNGRFQLTEKGLLFHDTVATIIMGDAHHN